MGNLPISTETNTLTNTMNIGDIVYLNSNPEVLMTILYILGPEPKNIQDKTISYKMRMCGYQEGDICCNWFENTKLQTNFFKAAMLTKKIKNN